MQSKSRLSRRGIEFKQTGVGAEESVAVAVRLNPFRPADGFEGDRKFFETIAGEVVKPEASTREQGAIGRFTKSGAGCFRKSLGWPEGLEAVAVVPEDTVFRAYPEKAGAILIDLSNREIAESFGGTKRAETELLRTQRGKGEEEHSEDAGVGHTLHSFGVIGCLAQSLQQVTMRKAPDSKELRRSRTPW